MGISIGDYVVCIGGENLILVSGRYASTKGTSEGYEIGAECL